MVFARHLKNFLMSPDEPCGNFSLYLQAKRLYKQNQFFYFFKLNCRLNVSKIPMTEVRDIVWRAQYSTFVVPRMGFGHRFRATREPSAPARRATLRYARVPARLRVQIPYGLFGIELFNIFNSRLLWYRVWDLNP